MDAQEKWQKARDILNNNPSEEQQNEAIALLNEAYSADHAGAAYTLAQIYYYGSFFERDLNKAYTLYKKAIELGFNKNNLLFAQMCIDGSVVEKNISKAEEILVSLAEEDVPEACAMLGWLGLERSELNLTNDEIWKWINRGASLGNNNCRLYKAKRLQFDGLDNDYFSAIKELSLNGNPLAYYHYAEALYLGIGCEKDAKEAVRWFELACKDGDARAMCYLGSRYLDGIGVESKDLGKAIELFTQSANLGFPTSMQNLGALYAQLCEDEKASFWFDKAIEFGMEESKRLKEEYFSSEFEERLNNAIHIYINLGNPQKALMLVEELNSKGDDRVLTTLLNIYLYGIGEESLGKDQAKAYNILLSKAKDGDAFANYMIAQFYEKGVVVKQDLDKSFEYYMSSAKAGYSEAQYKVGLYYIDIAGDKTEAAKWIELAANNEQPDALCMMAYSYLQDPEIGTMNIKNLLYDQDVQKGMQLLKRAAELKDSKATRTLAICYQKGRYVEEDKEKAFELLQKSVESNSTPESVNLLGDFYRDGIGTEQNYEMAAQCYTWAANNGNAWAMSSLSKLYREGIGVEKNEELADELEVRWWETTQWNIFGNMPLDVAREQAQQGDEEAMYQLGNRYDNGDGVEQNPEVASDWWFKAAIKGHVKAAHNLGNYYFYAKHDVKNGLRWLEKAASENSNLSLYVLGDIYINGIGIAQDVEKGLAYITKAADLDYPEAERKLSFLYHDGDVVEQDIDKSKYWLEKYLEHDSPDAHYRMGLCLYHGDMYETNYSQALAHFTEAVKGRCHDASPYYIDMLWRGNHAAQDRESVLATYKELDERGDAIASYYLYTLYNDEEYALRDKDTAITYLKKSAEGGYPVALRYMGFQYMEGGFFESDYNKANEYLAQAAEFGDTDAIINLARLYQLGLGVDKDTKKALEIYLQAAELGEIYAVREAAKIYIVGEGGVVDKDLDKASELLEKTADVDLESCVLLGFVLREMCELENNYSWKLAEESFHYMLKAANNGDPNAMYCVAYSYMEGRGVLWDIEKARLWFEKTLSKNHRTEDINKILVDYFSEDSDPLYPSYVYWHSIDVHNPAQVGGKKQYIDEKGNMNISAIVKDAAQCGDVNAAALLGLGLRDSDPQKAWEYMKLVIDSGYTIYAESMGVDYYLGKNVKKDIDRAVQYLAYGSELGDTRCKLRLGLLYMAKNDSDEDIENGKNLLMSVCETAEESSEEYIKAKSMLDRMVNEDNQTKSKLSKGFRSLFGKK